MLSLHSQVLVAFGNRVLSVPSGADPYAAKYKGIWVCLTILSRALSGNYVNFGVFDLYGDPALKVGRHLLAAVRRLVSAPADLLDRWQSCGLHQSRAPSWVPSPAVTQASVKWHLVVNLNLVTA